MCTITSGRSTREEGGLDGRVPIRPPARGFGAKGWKSLRSCRWPEVIDREGDEAHPASSPPGDRPRPKVDGRPPAVGQGPVGPARPDPPAGDADRVAPEPGGPERGGRGTAPAPSGASPRPAVPAPDDGAPAGVPAPPPGGAPAVDLDEPDYRRDPVVAEALAGVAAEQERARPRRSPFRRASASDVAVEPATTAPRAPTAAGISDALARSLATRRLPVAPEPPFTPCDGAYRWEVTLPSAVGRTTTVRVGSSGVELGGAAVAFDEIESVRFKLEVQAALFRRAASARMAVAVTRIDGTTVRAAARNALSTRRAEEIVSVLGYLWDVLGDAAGSRPRARVVERIAQGAEVVVGGLRLTRIGVAWKKNPIEPWSQIDDPVVERRSVVIPTSGAPIEVSIAADDAYVLPALIPELRRRFG